MEHDIDKKRARLINNPAQMVLKTNLIYPSSVYQNFYPGSTRIHILGDIL